MMSSTAPQSCFHVYRLLFVLLVQLSCGQALLGSAPSARTSTQHWHIHKRKNHFPCQRSTYPNRDAGYLPCSLNYKPYREMQVDLDMPHRWQQTNEETSSRRKMKTFLWSWLQQPCFQISRFWRTLRHFLFKRYTIYVVECEHGKYYVGSTTQPRQRWLQHTSGRGAVWTRRHPPIRQVFAYRRVPEPYYLGLESKITAEWMLKYGVNNVRGAMFAETRPYTLADVDKLTGFLGHYLDLSYPHVESTLRQSLPPVEDSVETNVAPRKRRRKIPRQTRRDVSSHICYHCGELGHHRKDCPKLPQVTEPSGDT